MLDKKHVYWLIPIALLMAGCVIWNVPLVIFWEITLLAWFSTLPGMLALRSFKLDLTSLERFTIGTALGLGITPILFIVLRTFDAWSYTSLLLSAFNLACLTVMSLRGGIDRKAIEPTKQSPLNDSRPLVLLCTVSVALVLFYNFSGIHYTADGSLAMRGLFAIDLPFLIGIMPSFDLTGHLSDMHQGGLQYAYHDFTYILIAVSKQVAGAEYFSLLAYSFPIFGMTVASASIYAFTRWYLVEAKLALLVSLGIILISSIWGDHLLTGALSPSYLAGIILMLAILLIVKHLVATNVSKSASLLLAMLLIVLIKSKLPIYLLIGGSIGILALTYSRRNSERALALLLPCIVSLPFLLLFSAEPTPAQPTSDFVIGAPLMGYGNQLASLLNVSPADVDPIVTLNDLEVEDLLIIPFSIVHLLRMIVIDARLLLLVIALFFLHGRMPVETRWMKRIAVAAPLLGIMLPLLYSPAWYPLAISFYTPELGATVAGIVALMMLAQAWERQLSVLAKGLVILCVAYGGVSAALHLYQQLRAPEYTMRSGEVKALHWLKQHTPANASIISSRYDLDLSDDVNDESFYLYAALSQRKLISSGAKYGGLLAAVSDVDTVKGLHPVREAQNRLMNLRSDAQTIYESSNVQDAPRIMQEYGSEYVLVSRSDTSPDKRYPKTHKQFETAYESDELLVLKLKR